MAEENVRIDLKSTADTAGFEKFESSFNTLRAAKQSHIGVNNDFVESERRVRTNLVDLVDSLAQARDGFEATSSAVKNLSEVVELGFAGTVIAGIGAAIIEQFAKADQAIKATTDNILKSIDTLKALNDEITGRKISPELKNEQALRKEETGFLQTSHQIGSGFFGKASIGLENLFGIGSGATNYRQAQADQALRGTILQSDMTAFAIKKVNDGFQAAGDKINDFTWSKEKPKTGELGTIDFQNALKADEDNAAAELKAAEEQGRSDRASSEASKKSDEAAKREAKQSSEAQDAAAREAAKGDAADSRPERISAHIYAGKQRELGGGGGVYSVITRDPVLDENRKQTGIQADIANMLKSHFSSAAPAAATLG